METPIVKHNSNCIECGGPLAKNGYGITILKSFRFDGHVTYCANCGKKHYVEPNNEIIELGYPDESLKFFEKLKKRRRENIEQ